MRAEETVALRAVRIVLASLVVEGVAGAAAGAAAVEAVLGRAGSSAAL